MINSPDQRVFSQYFTPAWAALQLWTEAVAPNLPSSPVVVEPTCGDGRMLAAVPSNIPAYGAEIHPALAQAAKLRSGRDVFCGDFFDWTLPSGANVAWGNPPFKAKFLDQLLDRFAAEFGDGGACWFITPAYFYQTPRRVLRWNRIWTLSMDMLPRTLWTKLETPIVFANFVKDPSPRLRGFRLYVEQDVAAACKSGMRDEVTSGSGRWSLAVRSALKSIGGQGELSEIYDAMLRKRPTENPHWREMIRKILQEGDDFVRVDRGVWALAA